MRQIAILFCVAIAAVWSPTIYAADQMPPDFARDVAPIFSKYCAGCHNNADREGDLSLESFAEIQQGGKKGTVVVSGRADASLMIRALNGEVEPAMPPPDNPHPTAKEIETLRAWIDAGAVGPTGTAVPFPEIKTPAIAPAAGVRPYLTSLAVSPDGKLLALGSYQRVELVDPMTKKVVATTIGLPGKVMSIAFSRDGARFVAGSGLTALIGAATICNATNGTIISQIKGHHDAIYRAEFSPDGQQLATCSYDRLVNLWNVADGKLIRSLTGHNGAVYDVAYSADGSLLASASADDTIKIWSAKTGERLDTLGQAEGEQHSVSFSSDSKFVVAAGSDRQLRLWTLLSREKPEINPLKLSRTAHNSAILKLAMSPDGTRVLTASEGRELVLWDSSTLTPIKRYEAQPDVVSGLAFAPGGKEFYIGCINGYWQKYSLPTLGEEQVASTSESASALLPAAVTPSEDVEALSKFAEQEPNNKATDANAIGTNAVVSGVIAAVDASGQPDVDLFRVHAQKGQKLVLEINAARSKSPLDSKLEVLTADGKAVPRVVLQAVRSSYYTFRGHDSTDLNDFRMHDAVEMEPNEYVYANGEVMKLWMLPRGPDSGFLVYPGIGANRFTYFGSTAITHALNEPIYIVQPHAPNETLIPNGLPVYTMYYENDDDGWRALGTDSRIAFTAPAEGDYLVRVSDVRGMGGEKYSYQLTVRPPHPDFEIKIGEKNLAIEAGSGKEFTVTATRKDEFDGEIKLAFSKLPAGFHITPPLTIEAGQTTAYGAVTADANAPDPASEDSRMLKVTASALVDGKMVRQKAMKVAEIKLAPAPKLLVHVLPSTAAHQRPHENSTSELVIAPGETIAATLKVERNGFDGDIKFGGEHAGRNLPHGVYIDNIGLNGVTLLKGESERTIYITARKWVPEQTRPFHLQAEEAGKQTSWPILIRVRNRAVAPAPASESVATTPVAN